MKKQSIAETTLLRQIKALDIRLENIRAQQRQLDAQFLAIEQIKNDLQREADRLYDVRVAASKKSS